MPGSQHGKIPRIVVGVDGSPSSREAIRWAVRQAALTGSSVDAVIAWQYPAPASGVGLVPIGVIDTADFEEIAAKALADAVSGAADPGSSVSVRQLVVEGNAAQALLSAAAGADLLVVGCRGHGGFAGALLGSVSQHCVHHAPCPVVVIRGDRHP
ncbi:MAG TPA: universal stress protein [Streptosporangiaceae bacterium]|nr:universal stress protein [Streptosporangiaceae bacterium]